MAALPVRAIDAVTRFHWAVRRGALPALRSWGSETLAHHALSNDTHRLDGRAGWVLETLATGQPRSVDELLVKAPFEASEAELEQLLLTLEQLGFAQRC